MIYIWMIINGYCSYLLKNYISDTKIDNIWHITRINSLEAPFYLMNFKDGAIIDTLLDQQYKLLWQQDTTIIQWQVVEYDFDDKEGGCTPFYTFN